LTLGREVPAQLGLLPTGTGQPRPVTADAINHQWATFLPDGKTLLFEGNEPGKSTRLYLQPIEGGTPRPLTPEGFRLVNTPRSVSPDGKTAVVMAPDNSLSLLTLADGSLRPIPKHYGDGIIGWDVSGKFLLISVYRNEQWGTDRLDPVSGAREPDKTLPVADRAGVPRGAMMVRISADGKMIVYSYSQSFSRLYLVEGLK
ncbi:MAG: hypothetical protein ABIO65_07515, partial [Nitrospiria bacterium]